jgi:hypothetical protein
VRIFALVGLLVTVAVIGFAAATYLSFITGPMTSVPDIAGPGGSGGDPAAEYNAVDRARMVVSMDRERQRVLPDQMDRLDGVTGSP